MIGKFWGYTEYTGPDEDFPDVKNVNAAVEYLGESHEKPLLYGTGFVAATHAVRGTQAIFRSLQTRRHRDPAARVEGRRFGRRAGRRAPSVPHLGGTLG